MDYKGYEIDTKTFGLITVCYEGDEIVFNSVEQAKAFIDGEKAKERFLLVWSSNWNQYWLYDEEKDAYLDIPSAVLEQLDKYDDEKAERAMNGILSENPSWLYDEEYLYDVEM